MKKTTTRKTTMTFTASALAKKKGVSPKAVRAYLRRHFDSPKDGSWKITARMAEAVLAA